MSTSSKVVVRNTPWTSQPQAGTPIDWSNPITKNMVLLYHPIRWMKDVVSGRDMTDNGATQTFARSGKAGKYVSSNGTGQPSVSFNGAVSMFALCTPSTTGTQCISGHAGNSNCSLWVPVSGAIQYSPDGGYVSSGVTVVADTEYKIGVSQNGTSGIICVDGKITTGTWTDNTTSSSQVFIGSRGSHTDWSWAGSITLFIYWARGLTQGELMSLNANPWQIFQPQRSYDFSKFSGGQGVTTRKSWFLGSSSKPPVVENPPVIHDKPLNCIPDLPTIDYNNHFGRYIFLAAVSGSAFGRIHVPVPGSYTTNDYGVGVGVTRKPTPFGVFSKYGGAGYSEYARLYTAKYYRNSSLSFVFVFYKTNSCAIGVSTTGPSGADDGTIRVLTSTSLITVSANADYFATSSIAAKDGLNVVIFTNDRARAEQRVYINGILDTAMNGASSGQSNFTARDIRQGFSTSGEIYVGYTATFDKIFTPEESFALANNPWQIFKPLRFSRIHISAPKTDDSYIDVDRYKSSEYVTPVLARNMLKANPDYLWTYDSGRGMKEHVRGAHADAGGQEVTIKASAYGKGPTGSGGSYTGITGIYSAGGKVDLTGISQFSSVTVVVFNSHGGDIGEESVLWRIDDNSNPSSACMAFDYFTDGTTFKIRPLIATNGTEGWTTSIDRTCTIPILGIPYVLTSRWISGGFMYTTVKPLGQKFSTMDYSAGVTPSGVTYIRNGGTLAYQNFHILGSAYQGYPVAAAPVTVLAVALFKRALSVQELSDYTENPQRLFGSIPRKIYVDNTPKKLYAPALVTTRKTRDSQPKTPTYMNTSNPLLIGLTHAFCPSFRRENLVGLGYTNLGNGTTVIQTGLSAKHDTGTGYSPIYVGGGGITVPAGSDYSVVVCTVPVLAGANPGVFRSGNSTFTNGQSGFGTDWCIFQGYGVNYPWIRINGVTVLYPSSGTKLVENVPTTIAYSIKSANFAKCAWNGQVFHQASHSTPTTAFTYYWVGAQTNNTETIGSISLYLHYNRALSDAEMCSITANPWQIFQPIRQLTHVFKEAV